MKVAIMQPSYLPWLGFFHLMAHADCFVLLDDAQFTRRSWQCRNRILVFGEESMLTIPIRKADRSAPIDHIKVDHTTNWINTHTGQLRAGYRRSPHAADVIAGILTLLETRPERLVEITIPIVHILARGIGLQTPIVLASDLRIPGTRSERLLAICGALGATDYLSPAGAQAYLREDRFTDQREVRLWIQRFVPRPYPQPAAPDFVPYLSALDLLAQHGALAVREHLKPWHFEEVSAP